MASGQRHLPPRVLAATGLEDSGLALKHRETCDSYVWPRSELFDRQTGKLSSDYTVDAVFCTPEEEQLCQHTEHSWPTSPAY
jgi:hypothetical protein